MKKTLFTLVLIPTLSAGAEQLWSEASVAACVQGKTTKSEVIEAIACLKMNPAAGPAIVEQFKWQNAKLVAADADVAAALADLGHQKSLKLYVKYQLPEGATRLMVVESAEIGISAPTVLYDLASLNIRYIPTSASFGQGESVPLQKVRSLRYIKKADYSGELTTSFVDGPQITDPSHKSGYLFGLYGPGEKRLPVVRFNGTTYPNKSVGNHLDLNSSALSGYILTFLTLEEGEGYVGKFEAMIAQQEKAKAEAQRVAAEERRIAAEKEVVRKAPILAAMLKAPMAQEDSCRRLGDPYVRGDPTDADIDCQFAGRINLSDLKSVGWLVVSKQTDPGGTVREYYIRKAR